MKEHHGAIIINDGRGCFRGYGENTGQHEEKKTVFSKARFFGRNLRFFEGFGTPIYNIDTHAHYLNATHNN